MNDAQPDESRHALTVSAVIAGAALCGLLLVAPRAFAAPHDGDTSSQLAMLVQDEKTPRQPRADLRRERDKASWALAFNDDFLMPGSRDQDYTAGLSASYSGANATRFWFSLDRPLGALDHLVHLDHQSPQGIVGHSIETGIDAFTPENIGTSRVVPNDRPYASLIYLSSSRVQVNSARNLAWHTTLTLGLLGVPLAGDAQNAVHKVIGSKKARGWGHQISDGGEPTARYEVARQRYLATSSNHLEVKSTQSVSVGYLTEGRWDLSFRYGRINSPWWRFNPDLASYGEGSSNAGRSGDAPEHYLWGGVGLVARAYNVFLEGQFRHSDRTYAWSQLNHGLLEAWLGYTFAFHNGYRISYVVRGHSSEVRHGAGNRTVMWGGLIVAKTF